MATAFGVTRSAVYDYIKRHPTLKRTTDDAREKLVDDAESALHAAVLSKEGWAVCFTLKTLGKDRGYIEKHQLEQQGSITIKVQYGDDGNAGNKGTDNKTTETARPAEPLSE